jgi:RNA polymerase sigma factor (sigma-70 family)
MRTVRTSAPVDWKHIYTQFHPALIEAAARCVGARADRDAWDVVHEVFVAVLSDPPLDEPDWREFLTALITELGAAECDSPQTTCIDDDPEDLEPIEDAATIAVRRVAACEVRQRILRVMGYMTERQQQITRLRLFEGLSVGEIALAMNTSSSNISQIVIRCLTKLQPVLTQFDTFDQHDLEGVRPPRRVIR